MIFLQAALMKLLQYNENNGHGSNVNGDCSKIIALRVKSLFRMLCNRFSGPISSALIGRPPLLFISSSLTLIMITQNCQENNIDNGLHISPMYI